MKLFINYKRGYSRLSLFSFFFSVHSDRFYTNILFIILLLIIKIIFFQGVKMVVN